MSKTTILLVEDERDLAFVLRANLKKEGYQVFWAASAEAALQLARTKKPDLILSDIMLPKMDGLELLKLLRQETQVPVMFLSAKKSEVDRILGFKLGADDYLVKPFSVGELLCRVKAILSRVQAGSGGKRPAQVRVGGIDVDFDRHEVRVKGKYRHLPPREFQLLSLLIEANGKTMTRDQLLKRLWGIDASMEVSTRTVDQHIARLRRNLVSEKRRIATVQNIGYRIRAD
ncbi:MAG TPA: response regulator transcription factor [Elusimicrobiota bacterium]|jgi:DNA-binding response OmpR family regulator|nr:response regulator transcription factor [Elusimicrobiota bacterium]